MFLAVLVEDAKAQSPSYADLGHQILNEGARSFIWAYLNAVLEHHNLPTSFAYRDAFIKFWKRSRYDLFKIGATSARRVKMHMSTLDYNAEMFRIKGEQGAEIYESRLGMLVNVLFPGSEELGLHRVPRTGVAVSAHSHWHENTHPTNMGVLNVDRNLLLEGLMEPMHTYPDVGVVEDLEEGELVLEEFEVEGGEMVGVKTVCTVPQAIAAVQRTAVGEIIWFLENVFLPPREV